jgi:sugar/nucleoside kinase (ribokinase family)
MAKMFKDYFRTEEAYIKIIAIGTAAVDYNLSYGKVYIGGCQLNNAIYAKMLGYKTSAYLGVIGDDEHGDLIKDTLNKHEVDYRYSRIEIGETDYSKYEMLNGERKFKTFERGVTKSSPLVLNEKDGVYIGDFNIVFTGRSAKVDNQLNIIPSGCLVVYDCQNNRYSDQELATLSTNVAMVTFSGSNWSDDEINWQVAVSHKAGIECVLITLGVKGQIFSVKGQRVIGKATETSVVDTLGCGDAFATAFALKLFENGWRRKTLPDLKSVHAALSFASDFSARIARLSGAFGVCYDTEGSN